MLEDIAARVAAGSSLHAAAANHTKVFPHHWIEVIRTGEVTGQMSLVLTELNKQIQDARATRRKISGAMMYPIILICVAVGAVTAMLWFVVPTFAKMFHDMGAELPGITQFVVDLSDWIVQVRHLRRAGHRSSPSFAFRWYFRHRRGLPPRHGHHDGLAHGRRAHRAVGHVPFASNIALLLKSGVPMLETIGVLEGVFHTSPVYREALETVHNRVAAGRPLAASLEETGLFTTMITNMVRIGEESGQLAPVMEQIAPYYKEKMESPDRQGHETHGADHHRLHGIDRGRADAVDLHADVRNVREKSTKREYRKQIPSPFGRALGSITFKWL